MSLKKNEEDGVKMFWTALATTGVLAAAGFPARDATAALGRVRAAVTVPTSAEASWRDAGGLVVLAGVLFGAAIGLRRRTPIAPTRRPD